MGFVEQCILLHQHFFRSIKLLLLFLPGTYQILSNLSERVADFSFLQISINIGIWALFCLFSCFGEVNGRFCDLEALSSTLMLLNIDISSVAITWFLGLVFSYHISLSAQLGFWLAHLWGMIIAGTLKACRKDLRQKSYEPNLWIIIFHNSSRSCL